MLLILEMFIPPFIENPYTKYINPEPIGLMSLDPGTCASPLWKHRPKGNQPEPGHFFTDFGKPWEGDEKNMVLSHATNTRNG